MMAKVYIDAIFRYSNETAFFNRMGALGVPARQGATGNGDNFSQQERFLYCTGNTIKDVVTEDEYMPVRLLQSDANKIPNNDQNPAFTIVWRSDEFDGEGNLLPRPEAERNIYDEDGVTVIGTRMQPVGIIL